MDTGANHRPVFFVISTGHRPDMNHMFGPQYTRLYHNHAFGSQYTRVYTLIRDPASHTDLSDDDAGIVAVTLGLIAGVGLILVARSLATLAVTTAVVAVPMALGGVSIVLMMALPIIVVVTASPLIIAAAVGWMALELFPDAITVVRHPAPVVQRFFRWMRNTSSAISEFLMENIDIF